MSKFIDTNEWVPVHTLPGYECAIEYHVNRNGDLKSTKGGRERILKRVTLKNGYQKYTIQQRLGQKSEKQVYAHTLGALSFLDNPPTPVGRSKGFSCGIQCDVNRSNNHYQNIKLAFIDGNRD